MSAVFHHKDLLLNDGEVIALFKLDDFDGRIIARGVTLGLIN